MRNQHRSAQALSSAMQFSTAIDSLAACLANGALLSSMGAVNFLAAVEGEITKLRTQLVGANTAIERITQAYDESQQRLRGHEIRANEVRDELAIAKATGAAHQVLSDLLADDAFAVKIARDCKDPAHDPRWCQTCETRVDGIDAYRAALADPLAHSNAT